MYYSIKCNYKLHKVLFTNTWNLSIILHNITACLTDVIPWLLIANASFYFLLLDFLNRKIRKIPEKRIIINWFIILLFCHTNKYNLFHFQLKIIQLCTSFIWNYSAVNYKKKKKSELGTCEGSKVMQHTLGNRFGSLMFSCLDFKSKRKDES